MQKFKKILFTVSAAMIIAGIACVSAAASAPPSTGTVNVGTALNVRAAGSASSQIIGRLSSGQCVTIIGDYGGWYEISFNGSTGWVSSSYIIKLVTTGRVSASALNVRASCTSGSAVLGRLSYGDTVSIFDSMSGYYEISYNGQSAWVSRSYISGIATNGITDSKASTAVNAADAAVGTKYVYGGASLAGFDCSGLTMYAYAKAGITLPHSSSMQATKGTAVAKADLRPGDLVFFDTSGGHSTINHVGIYIGDGLFVSAQSGYGAVSIANIDISYWSSAYMTARRVTG